MGELAQEAVPACWGHSSHTCTQMAVTSTGSHAHVHAVAHMCTHYTHIAPPHRHTGHYSDVELEQQVHIPTCPAEQCWYRHLV